MPDAQQYNAYFHETKKNSQAKDLGRKDKLSQKGNKHSFKLTPIQPSLKGSNKIVFTLSEVFFTNSARKRKIAFTLAEVLITLGIIGVVAALTLPTLIQNYQKKQTVTQLKKAYSEISQAIYLAQKDNGTIDSWDFANFDTNEARASEFVENYLKPNIKTLQFCMPTSNECWPNEGVYALDGSILPELGETTSGSSKFSFITASGYSVYAWLHASGVGAWFYIDINGSKKPNMLGKDIFVFVMSWGKAETVPPATGQYIRKLGFYPYGLDGKFINPTREQLINGSYEAASYLNAGCHKGVQGHSCAALIINDGWEISDDYPW